MSEEGGGILLRCSDAGGRFGLVFAMQREATIPG